MKWGRTLVIALLLIAGCSGHNQLLPTHSPSITALAGSSIDHVSLVSIGSNLEIALTEIPEAGTFFRINLPNSRSLTNQEWSGDAAVLHLAAATHAGIEIGVIPLDDYRGGPVAVQFALGNASRTAATAPRGYDNIVEDLKVVQIEEGLHRLTWTERNTGDYNLDGLVGVSDMTPIGQYYGGDVASGGAPEWVDGNNNGLIEVGDITPIGSNYEAYWAGYVVWRNGTALQAPAGGEITIARSEADFEAGRPVYEIELTGEVGDTWYVTPVDSSYPDTEAGSESVEVISEPVILDADLLIDLDFTGIETFELNSLQNKVINDGDQILRIIDPGEIVNNFEIGERLLVSQYGVISVDPGGQIMADELPREVPLILDIIYAPKVDFENGLPRLEFEDKVPDEYHVVAAIPFILPAEETHPTVLSISISNDEKPVIGSGYHIETIYTCITDGGTQEPDSCMRRLDFAQRTVSQITAVSHDYSDEIAMPDPDRDGISDQLLLSKNDLVTFGEPQYSLYLLEGTIDAAYDPQAGYMTLNNTMMHVKDDLVPMQTWDIHFNESTRFGSVVDETLDNPLAIDPTTIVAGDKVLVKFYVFKDAPGDADRVWAEIIAKYL